MTGTFAIPNSVFDDPYFTKEKRVFSRAEALAWIARHVRWTDNCVLKRGQGSWSIRYLAEAWGWAKTRVERFLKKLESMNILRCGRVVVSGTPQTLITYVISTAYEEVKTVGGTEPGQQRDRTGTKTNTDHSDQEESDSSLRSESCRPGMRMPPVEEVDNGDRPDPDFRAANSESTQTTSAPRGTTSGGKKPKAPPPGYCSEFEEFWQACPLRRGSKHKAYLSWWKLTEAERQLALEGAMAWKRNSVGKEAKYVAHVTTWLNGRRWETEVEAAEEDARMESARYCV